MPKPGQHRCRSGRQAADQTVPPCQQAAAMARPGKVTQRGGGPRARRPARPRSEWVRSNRTNPIHHGLGLLGAPARPPLSEARCQSGRRSAVAAVSPRPHPGARPTGRPRRGFQRRRGNGCATIRAQQPIFFEHSSATGTTTYVFIV